MEEGGGGGGGGGGDLTPGAGKVKVRRHNALWANHLKG